MDSDADRALRFIGEAVEIVADEPDPEARLRLLRTVRRISDSLWDRLEDETERVIDFADLDAEYAAVEEYERYANTPRAYVRRPKIVPMPNMTVDDHWVYPRVIAVPDLDP